MNISQKMLFARVGFTPAALQLLCGYIEQEQITERTARRWASGEFLPRNDYYIKCANALDEYLTAKASLLINEHRADTEHCDDVIRLILPYYNNDDDYWTATGDMPCPVSVYHQLLQRIELMSGIPVFYLNDDSLDNQLSIEIQRDWDNYVNLSVGFDFSLSESISDLLGLTDPFDDDSD